MMLRRPLSALLSEVAEGAAEGARGAPVAIREIEMEMPVELRFDHSGGEMQLLGDVPLFITRTAFDAPPSRLFVRWAAEPAGDGG
ncbi:hypothetical protein [Erythrobacter sp. EC-HK427]|uniref:hypothetical protein n=1 Tax=Erythrobacter sp. EC-HK427 TaxID=2038396 RepID=UPI0012565D29|nr:hypothetical protein [Erythrobacter sp. EC-HK427]VVT12248.1 conserved hypothetical protein [Erythrobacter sp. EC-HK427]